MTTNEQLSSTAPSVTPEEEQIDWLGAVRTALGSAFIAGVVSGGLHLVNQWALAQAARIAAERAGSAETAKGDDDDDGQDEADAIEAAELLGVSLDASPDQIRAALRAKMTADRLHPDQGGDGVEATRLIAAKNLLIERARGLS